MITASAMGVGAYTRPMDEFGVFVFGSLIAVFLIFYAIGKWYPGSGAEQVDWRPTRSPEVEAELEMEDLQQMLDAQNERRRRTRAARDHRGGRGRPGGGGPALAR